MTLDQLLAEYKEISEILNEKWPLRDQDHRTFARIMKIVEELGELSDEILTSMNLQRNSKIAQFSHQNIEDEFADVVGSLILLGHELDIDFKEAMQRKIALTRERFGMDDPSTSQLPDTTE